MTTLGDGPAGVRGLAPHRKGIGGYHMARRWQPENFDRYHIRDQKMEGENRWRNFNLLRSKTIALATNALQLGGIFAQLSPESSYQGIHTAHVTGFILVAPDIAQEGFP